MAKEGAVDRQRKIFIGALQGRKPASAFDYNALRAEAKRKLTPEAFDYIEGGAGRESTMIANCTAFQDRQILPHMMHDVSQRSCEVEIFGKRYRSPFFLCPIGVLSLAHPEADLAVAKAASDLQIPFIFSSQASVRMEETTAIMKQSPRMFQLYWSKSDELVQSFINRASECGCDAIIVTVDTTLLGWRYRDLQHGFLPFLYALGMAQYTSDPVFIKLVSQFVSTSDGTDTRPSLALIKALWKMSRNFPGNTWSNFRYRRPLAAVHTFIDVFMRPWLEWSDIKRLKSMTKLPVVIKGIQSVRDATMAIEAGADGILVSNHGGRQIDGAVGSLDALSQISREVGDQVPLWFDSGIRTGSDAFKAIALGAKAVGIGRPYVYALAAKGTSGVKDFLRNFLAEFELTMALAGCASPAEITRDYIVE